MALRFKTGLVFTAAFLLALFLGLYLSFLMEERQGGGRALRGIASGSVLLEGMDEAGILQEFTSRAQKLEGRRVVLTLGDSTLELEAVELGLSLGIERAARSALSAGRAQGHFGSFAFWFQRLFTPYLIELRPALKRDVLEARLSPWGSKELPLRVSPDIRFDKKLVVEFGEAGTSVDLDALAQTLLVLDWKETDSSESVILVSVPTQAQEAELSRVEMEALAERAQSLVKGPISISSIDGEHQSQLSVQDLGAAISSKISGDPKKMTLELSGEALRNVLAPFLQEVLIPAEEASFEFDFQGKPSIAPSQIGERLDEKVFIEALWKAADSQERSLILPVEAELPKLTTEDAEALGIRGLASSFTTRHACCRKRVKNIHHAAEKLDGVVLRPGETFSLNELLGPRTKATGYFEAPTIVHGKMKKTFGGGISQLATTLFNAALRGGYEIVQRQPHSIYFPRYPEGHEATVSFPEPDLIFKNDTKAGLVIRTKFSGTFIKVLLYGDNEGRKVSRSKSKRYKVVEIPKEYEGDEEMDPEDSKRLRAGQQGWTVLMTTKITHADGRVSEATREVVYNARPELLRVHPCMIPEGEEGYTGDDCPEPEREEREEELSDEYFETEN